jgi:hypothetical protein
MSPTRADATGVRPSMSEDYTHSQSLRFLNAQLASGRDMTVDFTQLEGTSVFLLIVRLLGETNLHLILKVNIILSIYNLLIYAQSRST